MPPPRSLKFVKYPDMERVNKGLKKYVFQKIAPPPKGAYCPKVVVCVTPLRLQKNLSNFFKKIFQLQYQNCEKPEGATNWEKKHGAEHAATIYPC